VDGGEPQGYNEFIASVDALVIGRNTFETVLAFPEWPYGKKRVVVLNSKPLDLSKVRGGAVEQMSGTPSEIVAKLAATGAHHLYVDGGITIQRFLRAGPGSTSHHHACARAHRRRNSTLRNPAERCAS
jgi:dihydrofolate reductase